ncbi:MAG: hypothetical protein HOP28_07340, partial [Gemmatimonadales bacterium]|nr:hypothetical protein [Gemmatimonadales bacterium]
MRLTAGTPATLDVPYLSQSVLLCGGAALAMVERWWGRRGVYSEDFANLVKPALGGILTTDLAAAAVARGWDARVFHGPPDLVRQYLTEGVPVVALIQVARNRFHYVVVVGWGAGRVTFHDPAGAPFTSVDEAMFLTRWAAADRWAMALRPAPDPTSGPPVAPANWAPPDPMPCAPWLDHALDAVAARQLDDASRLLSLAGRNCPWEPLVLRELAGVRFKQGRHVEAIPLAAEYLSLVPGDRHGWQLLASSRYLTGDENGALDAWNRAGRPTIDLVRIDGTREVRFQRIAAAISLPHGAVLTRSRLALARRRVSDVPALRWSAVDYQPVAGGVVEVRVAVVERPGMEPAWLLAASNAVRALAQNEVGLEVASPLGTGELWKAAWRWQSARSRASVQLDLPANLGFPGVVHVEGAREQFRFAPDPSGAAAAAEARRFASLGFSAWAAGFLRSSAAQAL